MLICVSGADAKAELTKLLQGKKSANVNFCLKGKTLYLQSVGNILNDIRLDVLSVDATGAKFDQMTISIDQTIQLIDGKSVLLIEPQAETMTLRQEKFRFISHASPVERTEFDLGQLELTETLNIPEFIGNVQSSKMLDPVSKSLTVGMSPIIVVEGSAYVVYSNTVMISDTSLADCSISAEVARAFVPVATKHPNSPYAIDREKGVIVTTLSERETTSMTVQKPNYQVVNGIKTIESKLKEIGNFSMAKYGDAIDIISKAYGKSKVELSISTDGIGLFISNGYANFYTGELDNVKVSITISTAQLSVVGRLFRDSQVTVYRGDNCICLKQQSSNRRLILAGMLY